MLGDNPTPIVAYFFLIPITALVAGILGKGEGHLSPWKYLYSTLVYLVCVPGILAITLSVYLFLFERRSVFDTDIFTQILPVLSMVGTLLLIRKNVPLERIPGFGKMSGLIMMILTTLFVMWILDKTRLIAFSYIPFQYVILMFIGLLVIFRIGWSRIFSSSENRN